MLIICIPPRLTTGRMKFSPPRAPSCTPNIWGMEGPGYICVQHGGPVAAARISQARRLVTKLLPTPPCR